MDKIYEQFSTRRFDEKAYNENIGFQRISEHKIIYSPSYQNHTKINLTKSDELNIRSFQKTPNQAYLHNNKQRENPDNSLLHALK